MTLERLLQTGDSSLSDTHLTLPDRVDGMELQSLLRHSEEPARINLTRDTLRPEMLWSPSDCQAVISPPDFDAHMGRSEITIANFVEHVFLKEQVATKKTSGRIHYQAILKHVLTPEEVDRIFHPGSERQTRLKSIPNWPYLSNMRLHEVRPEDVERLLNAASAQGYSQQTVRHIRSVIATIFTCAWKKRLFRGDNPATPVTVPAITDSEAHALTLVQTRQVIGMMRYPAKELALLAMLTDMNIAEICGLQWKFVNLTAGWSDPDTDPIPPRSIAVRRQWYLGELGAVNRNSQNRILPISDSLLPILRLLRSRADFTGPDDFVLVSKRGTPIDERRIAVRHLKPLGNDLQIPWLTWRVLRRTRTKLQNEFGMLFHDLIASRSVSDIPNQ